VANLKAVYEDFAVDVGRILDAVLVRAIALGELAEGLVPDRVRALRCGITIAAIDIDHRFAAFERRLNEFRPTAADREVGLGLERGQSAL